ncbi:hypothetical protein NDU88_004641 [Pleurodeles waltl]|uniref:Uncharacterized protein n=1 Tax=Pleurodeles waltl TaxID=8319 RepID=A0AAV7PD51_PLEWA|nr:hypothetical protein NDU88_004641 [Pleurodeles waltl]
MLDGTSHSEVRLLPTVSVFQPQGTNLGALGLHAPRARCHRAAPPRLFFSSPARPKRWALQRLPAAPFRKRRQAPSTSPSPYATPLRLQNLRSRAVGAELRHASVLRCCHLFPETSSVFARPRVTTRP